MDGRGKTAVVLAGNGRRSILHFDRRNFLAAEMMAFGHADSLNRRRRQCVERAAQALT